MGEDDSSCGVGVTSDHTGDAASNGRYDEHKSSRIVRVAVAVIVAMRVVCGMGGGADGALPDEKPSFYCSSGLLQG